MKAIMKAFWEKDWTMSEKILLTVDVLLAGVLIGWLTSPFRGGFFSNNEINSNYGLSGEEPGLEDIFEEE